MHRQHVTEARLYESTLGRAGDRLKVQPWRSTRLKTANDIAGREIRATIYARYGTNVLSARPGLPPIERTGVSSPGPHTIAVVERADIFDALAAAFSTGQVEVARRLFSADYLDHQRPEDMDLIGPDEFTAVVAGARRSLGELAVRVASAVTWADDLCVAVLAWRGRDRSGAVVERETVETLRLDATGKIAEHWGLEVRCRDAAQHRRGSAALAGRADQRR